MVALTWECLLHRQNLTPGLRAWVGEISVSKEVVLKFFLQYLHLLGALNVSYGVQDIFRIDIVPGLIGYNQPISSYFQGF